MKDFTEYPEYTYDRQVRDLEEIIKSLEAKIEKQEKQLSLYGVSYCEKGRGFAKTKYLQE